MEINASQPQHPKYLPGLEILRGLLAIWVIVGHCLIFTLVKTWQYGNPHYPVFIFFLLSAFLMTWNWRSIYAENCANRFRLSIGFYIKRFMRVTPSYYFFLFCSLIFWWQFQQMRDNITSENYTTKRVYEAFSFENIYLHATYLFGFSHKYWSSIVAPDWTIGLEMQFYAVFPLLYFLAKIERGILITIIAILLAYPGAQVLFNHIPSPQSFIGNNLKIFWTGMLIAYIATSRNRIERIIFILCFLALLTFARFEYFHLVLILIFSFFVTANRIKMPPNIFKKIFFFLGDISYNLYLSHLFFLIPITHVLLRQKFYQELPIWYCFALVLFVTLALSIIVSSILHYHLEKPGIRLGAKLARRFGVRHASTPQRSEP